MTFLKKLGHAALETGKVLLGSFLGTVRKDVPIAQEMSGDLLLAIFQQVAQGEISGVRLQLTGAQKRQLVAAVVEQIILRSPIARGKKLLNPTKFRTDVDALVGTCADILNDFEEDGVETRDVA